MLIALVTLLLSLPIKTRLLSPAYILGVSFFGIVLLSNLTVENTFITRLLDDMRETSLAAIVLLLLCSCLPDKNMSPLHSQSCSFLQDNSLSYLEASLHVEEAAEWAICCCEGTCCQHQERDFQVVHRQPRSLGRELDTQKQGMNLQLQSV